MFGKRRISNIAEILDASEIQSKPYDWQLVTELLKSKVSEGFKVVADADDLMIDVKNLLGEALVTDGEAN